LYALLTQQGRIYYVQIGANDGRSFDPIHNFVTLHRNHVAGLAVEPLKDLYEELKCTYSKCPGVVPVNVAIHNTEKEMLLYRVDPQKVKSARAFTKGIASFNKDHHRITKVPDDLMVAEKVRCMSLAALLEEHAISQFDVLVIDTEGYDAEILRGIDLGVITPKIIRFEHAVPYGVMAHDEFNALCDRLRSFDYELIIESNDAIAYKRNLFLDTPGKPDGR
jgi:FkbM family methyltransferase